MGSDATPHSSVIRSRLRTLGLGPRFDAMIRARRHNYFMLLLAALFMSATILQGMSAVAVASEAPMSMAQMAASADDMGTMKPCRDVGMTCFADAGCLWTMAVPTVLPVIEHPSSWSVLAYWPLEISLGGRSIEPALAPPITLA
jgi:hypothetical protein